MITRKETRNFITYESEIMPAIQTQSEHLAEVIDWADKS